MGELWGIALRRAAVCSLLVGLGFALPVGAEEALDDAAARDYFERGREAFDAADYESSLVYFQHAYRLSHRSALQYNIGVAADRLQREEEALIAFERYLAETENPSRRIEVEERIHALRESLAEREARERELEEAAARHETSRGANAADGKRIPTSAIAGSSSLAALGVAGVVAMSVGLAKNGTCTREVMGTCVTESSATAWTWVYGGLGVAALAGSAAWLGVSFKRGKKQRETRISLTPSGVSVSGMF